MGGFRVKDQIAAPYTPMNPDGEINFSLIPAYADYLVATHFTGIFINGSLSESLSLTLAERKQLTETWLKAAKGRLEVIVHVGSNCLKDSQVLAQHAEALGAEAITAYAPSYYKPENEEVLLDYMVELTKAAPKTPFYYYEINFRTGLYINVRKFCEMAKEKIPTFRGLKHSSREMFSLHSCTMVEDVQVLAGTDFQYLTSLTLGVTGVVANSYLGNICYDMRTTFLAGNLDKAREVNETAAKIQTIRMKYGGGFNITKALFKILTGIDVGPVRLPLRALTSAEYTTLENDVIQAGIIDVARPKKIAA